MAGLERSAEREMPCSRRRFKALSHLAQLGRESGPVAVAVGLASGAGVGSGSPAGTWSRTATELNGDQARVLSMNAPNAAKL
jgi:hypothetical protein